MRRSSPGETRVRELDRDALRLEEGGIRHEAASKAEARRAAALGKVRLAGEGFESPARVGSDILSPCPPARFAGRS